jgi:hypothetical protein
MVTHRCGSGRERAPKSLLQAALSGCKNVRLRVNHTMGMPAKIGPKRDRALARAGCYFDSSATTCGAEVFGLRRESGCVRAIMIVTLACAGVQCASVSPRHCEPTGGRANARPMTGSAKQSIALRVARWIASAFALRATVDKSSLRSLAQTPAPRRFNAACGRER